MHAPHLVMVMHQPARFDNDLVQLAPEPARMPLPPDIFAMHGHSGALVSPQALAASHVGEAGGEEAGGDEEHEEIEHRKDLQANGVSAARNTG